MAWYKTGTVSVTNNSATVTGSGTNFVSGAQVGFGFQGPNGLVYEITAINSSTSLTITPVYGGSTASGQSYAIVPTQGLTAALASDVTDLITDYQTVADNAGAGKFGDGSAASPGIRFVNDQDTGFFKDTANEIAVSVGGAKVGEFTSTGIDGTVIGGTTPAAITATTFTSTGIDDNASSTAMTLDSSGNVGIGTSSPQKNLHLSGGLPQYMLFENKDNTVSAGEVAGGLLFMNGDDSTPSGDRVATSIKSVCEDGFGRMALTFSAGHTNEKTVYGSAADYTDATIERMRIDSSGNLGIGTSSPTDKLNVSSGSNQIGLDTGDQATYGTLDLGHFANGAFIGTQAGTSAISNLLRFGTSGSERMRIDSSGATLLGTTSAGSAGAGDLVVNGGVYLGGTGSANKLTDYEEGTHNVTLTVENGSIAVDGSYNKVKYTKVGRIVHMTGRIRIGTVTSASGYVRFNLPFTAETADEDSSYAALNVYTYGINAAGVSTFAEITSNNSYAVLLQQVDNANWSYLNASGFTSGDILHVNGSFVAQ